jgi:hypothetical protein
MNVVSMLKRPQIHCCALQSLKTLDATQLNHRPGIIKCHMDFRRLNVSLSGEDCTKIVVPHQSDTVSYG